MHDPCEIGLASSETDNGTRAIGDSHTDRQICEGGRRGRVSCRRVAIDELRLGDRDAMYRLFERHYDQTNRNRFEQDLNAKRWVLQLFDSESGQICGFSTQTLLRTDFCGQTVRVLFSGDTIVDPLYWGETALIRHWGRLVAELIKVDPSEPLYWFLISKGYKTYRFLQVFFREYFPRFDRETPPTAKALIDTLGCQMFPLDYDSGRGIVVATPDKDRLRSELARVEPSRTADPNIRYFLERNPNYSSGDELCCLAPLEFRNFTSAGVRLLDAEHQRFARQERSGRG